MSREYPFGASPGIPMRLCPDCNYPAVYDAFGQTDHVCATGPRAELWQSIVPHTTDGPTRVIFESTARVMGDSFYERCQRGH